MNIMLFSILCFGAPMMDMHERPEQWFAESLDKGCVIRALDEAMYKELMAGNKWGFLWLHTPYLKRDALSYCNEIWIDFFNRKYISAEDAEKLYVDVYRELIQRLNSVRILRPFLAEFPLTPKTFKLCIGFKDNQGKPLLPPYISAVSQERDVVDFSHFRPFNHNRKKYEEPYYTVSQHAISDIAGLSELYAPILERVSPGPKPRIPVYTSRPECYNSPLLSAKFTCAKRICAKHNLELVVIGSVSEKSHDYHPFSFGFRGSQRLSIEEARKVAMECLREILTFARTNKDIHDQLRSLMDVKDTDSIPCPQPNHVILRLSFWDEDVNRVEKPYIAEIRVSESVIKYFVADEFQRLELLREEKWEGDVVDEAKIDN